MFIDDNPMNRYEAQHFVPGIEVADEHFIADILADPRFKGKDDSSLTRLAQYKLLENKSNDLQVMGDNTAFLRASDIRVTIDNDVVSKLDRAIELINRTNQLNFTKIRLPENQDDARKELNSLLSEYNIQSGLIHVQDRYGDYGYIGIYITRSNGARKNLIHFCFSCRTLGMGVETWMYERLSRPDIRIVGEVLADISVNPIAVDWINAGSSTSNKTSAAFASHIVVRGGCDLTPVAHYLGLTGAEVIGEFNIVRSGLLARIDHSSFLRDALENVTKSPSQLEAIRSVGYEPDDFKSSLTSGRKFDACVFSFWLDAFCATYHHRRLDFAIPFTVPPGDKNAVDIRNVDESEIRRGIPVSTVYDKVVDLISELRNNYDYRPPSTLLLQDNISFIIKHIPQSVHIFILLAAEQYTNESGDLIQLHHLIAHNRAVSEVVGSQPNIHLLRISDFVERPEEMINPVHFSRMVYFRLYEAIAQVLKTESLTKATVEVASD